MTNRVNYRRSKQKKRTEDQSHRALSCGGIGANGARGRTVWKRISARKERRSEKGKNLPSTNPFRHGSRKPFIRPSISDE